MSVVANQPIPIEAVPAPALLEVQGLKKHFPVGKGVVFRRNLGSVKAVDGISFAIPEQKTLSIVGESGCGKTTTTRMVLGLEKPTEGEVLFRGKSLYNGGASVQREYRRAVHAVFQDPWGSLDPRMRVSQIIGEPLRINTSLSARDIEDRASELLLEVGLHPRQAQLYPHEFSGGQRQRIALARALALKPSLIVLDEPVSALDVSIRAQIMNLLKDLQDKHGLSYLLIAHNLATVRYLSNQVAVMYLGRIVELAESETLFTDPQHPYTQALLRASLPAHPRGRRELTRLPGEVPSPLSPPPGCAFHTRCQERFTECDKTVPILNETASRHWTACHLYPPRKLCNSTS